MSAIFLFERGHRNGIDEDSRPETIESIVDQDEFLVVAIATHSKYVLDKCDPRSSAFPIQIDRPTKDGDGLVTSGVECEDGDGSTHNSGNNTSSAQISPSNLSMTARLLSVRNAGLMVPSFRTPQKYNTK
ncbi:hypothetical protein INT45_013250 [Circinella minor]|uniref:Uncharacterized protein n=1 Tax=Circinella minor TaxID=1195481 RepID=A0A8H7S3A0_9FUNG|nr:hypothetical protein INT45_013250 [Circinella minor]